MPLVRVSNGGSLLEFTVTVCADAIASDTSALNSYIQSSGSTDILICYRYTAGGTAPSTVNITVTNATIVYRTPLTGALLVAQLKDCSSNTTISFSNTGGRVQMWKPS